MSTSSAPIAMRGLTSIIKDGGLTVNTKAGAAARHGLHRKRRLLITSITVDGIQHDSPLKKQAAAKYREYSFGLRVVEFRAAAEIGRAVAKLVKVAEPEAFNYAQSGEGAVPNVLSMAQELRAEAARSLQSAVAPLESYARIVNRMAAIERLGGKD